MASKHHGYSRLEAGLLDTREEEKAPFITPAPDHSKLDAQRPSGKMSPIKRVGLIIAISLFVGLGLALARDPSVTAPCMRWVHGAHQVPSRIARTALNKRQDASLANATTPAISTEQSKTTANPVQSSPPAVVSSSSLPLTTVPVVLPTSTAAAPSSPAPEATSTSTPKAPQQTSQQTSQPPQASTTSTAPQGPVATSSNAPATTPGQVETSSTPPSPDTSAPTTSDVAPTSSSKFEKTITAGRVATSSPVPHVMTTTLPNGGTLTITSTSWVAVVPTEKATSTSEPKLQNAAPRSRGSSNLILAVGAATLGMLLI
ncbi:hypothetical protein E4U13_001114 [Claviceps humidiphila]|uniref:Uncharacterized protein n=1 Tax=Claviceps humidiphila TaxID=1294629 RepID=A0A9P7TX18_9HYPO|nr:hypothetical protein E4U13_001114 [Claviceps humidiphila]